MHLLAVLHAAEKIDVSIRWEIGSGFPFSDAVGYYDRLKLRKQALRYNDFKFKNVFTEFSKVIQ